jgi:hypothetical protein
MPTEQPTSRVRPVSREHFDAIEPANLVERYRAGPQRLDPRVFELTDDRLDRVFGPEEGVGLWSCRALLTHLMDTELLYVMRLRRAIAEDCPVFENFDERAFLDSRLSRPGPESLLLPPGAAVAMVHTARQATAVMLMQLTPEDWERRAMNPYLGESTIREMVAYICWHFEHHSAFLSAKTTAMLGPAPECEDRARGGCGAGCTCVPADGA